MLVFRGVYLYIYMYIYILGGVTFFFFQLTRQDQFYVIWHVEWDAVKGEGFTHWSHLPRDVDSNSTP